VQQMAKFGRLFCRKSTGVQKSSENCEIHDITRRFDVLGRRSYASRTSAQDDRGGRFPAAAGGHPALPPPARTSATAGDAARRLWRRDESPARGAIAPDQ